MVDMECTLVKIEGILLLHGFSLHMHNKWYYYTRIHIVSHWAFIVSVCFVEPFRNDHAISKMWGYNKKRLPTAKGHENCLIYFHIS